MCGREIGPPDPSTRVSAQTGQPMAPLALEPRDRAERDCYREVDRNLLRRNHHVWPSANKSGDSPADVSCRAGHDHDYARLRLLTLLDERQIPASVTNDFADLEKWLPVSRLLVTYVAGPYPGAGQCAPLKSWLEAGGHWLALHGTSGGRAERVEGLAQRRTVRTEHHALLGSMFLTHPPACR